MLHPQPDAALLRNAASCVLLIEAGERRALLSGDIEAATETQLVQARILPTVDLASVPHHGSLTSSIMPFVLSLAPRYAVVSASYTNQWGMPKPQVVARWRRAHATVLNTATSGAIEARLCRHVSQISLQEYRKTAHRPWHADN
jgi:competence protein ComEC